MGSPSLISHERGCTPSHEPHSAVEKFLYIPFPCWDRRGKYRQNPALTDGPKVFREVPESSAATPYVAFNVFVSKRGSMSTSFLVRPNGIQTIRAWAFAWLVIKRNLGHVIGDRPLRSVWSLAIRQGMDGGYSFWIVMDMYVCRLTEIPTTNTEQARTHVSITLISRRLAPDHAIRCSISQDRLSRMHDRQVLQVSLQLLITRFSARAGGHVQGHRLKNQQHNGDEECKTWAGDGRAGKGGGGGQFLVGFRIEDRRAGAKT